MSKRREIHYCRECGRAIKARRTKTGLCGKCRVRHLRENVEQIKKREGEYYEKWLAGMMKWMIKEYERR